MRYDFCVSVIDMMFEVSEITQCFPADFENLFEIDGVDTALAGFEGNYLKA